MAKLAMFVPYSSLCGLSRELVRNYPRMEPVFVDAVANDKAAAKARELVAQSGEKITQALEDVKHLVLDRRSIL